MTGNASTATNMIMTMRVNMGPPCGRESLLIISVVLGDEDGNEGVLTFCLVEDPGSIGDEQISAAGAAIPSLRVGTGIGRSWPAEGGGVLSPRHQSRTGEGRRQRGVEAGGHLGIGNGDGSQHIEGAVRRLAADDPEQ